ncbi:MAG: hypothetical protein ACRENP_08895 [Longimicrobiales bacterium]
MKTKSPGRRFVVCVDNTGYQASLEIRKIYEVVPDAAAARLHQLRVIDESGEDYLFPEDFFLPIELSQEIRAALRKAS